jgi:hypothetical protein
MKLCGTIVCLLFSLLASPASAQDLALDFPLGCTLGADCWVQQYVDQDATPAAKDYACGAETYDGHDGTDIRARDTAQHVAVLAAADGNVKALRDGVEDHLVKSDADRAAVKKIECGNGVVITHADGWQTQYCHLRKGSVQVKVGDAVKAGDQLGQVGYSGDAAFPHLHFTVRQNGKTRDPFGAGTCNPDVKSLWRKQPAYAQGEILAASFQSGPVEITQLEIGQPDAHTPSSDWPALVAYAWIINLQSGDRITVTLDGPNSLHAENTATLDRAKAQYMLFAGKKSPAGGWLKGHYAGHVTVQRSGVEALQKSWQTELK